MSGSLSDLLLLGRETCPVNVVFLAPVNFRQPAIPISLFAHVLQEPPLEIGQ